MTESTDRKIKFEFEGKPYVLEYDRDSVVATEKALGVSLQDILSYKVSSVRDAFTGAFIKNHAGTPDETVEAIWQAMPDKRKLISTIGEMYALGINSLVGEPDKGNAISWTAE
ncbi:DUF5055 domain-containing protein [Adlercreutzia sp. R25]|uniref:DUF5055 domain-containing protein n=1 Tax=Adlercreutzia shanghongiae TaxID=3111773 RepID=UPI002DB829F7|nr:DUF5055 domain-containing protein [Adlercreutzia sp. R25]MEC4272962.1 DUF5055 domain-containing protein [Adlercreutzia sp. R25]